MPKIKCAYGFNCASMLQDWSLKPEDCPNRETCGLIRELSPEEEVVLYQARIEENQRIVEERRVRQSQAAIALLNSRGCPQTAESLGLYETLQNLQNTIEALEDAIGEIENEEGYIAPPQVEVHPYLVKRGSNSYQYNKLSAQTAIFEPQEKTNKVKNIHLSKDDDSRNIEARKGIERRNKLIAARSKITKANRILNAALAEL